MTNQHQYEVAHGERFEFGNNWSKFLSHLDDRSITKAEQSLSKKLGVKNLKGRTFLDIGSGSGLFSLAARRLGAKVYSFDYDPESVACTTRLKGQYFPNDPDWIVAQGSVLDDSYVQSLGQFDVVYSWGVLHHTGNMWHALENAIVPVGQGGTLFIAIYNDQGVWSRRWLKIKRLYNRLPKALKFPFAVIVMGIRELPSIFWDAIKLNPSNYIRSWTQYSDQSLRGMSRWHDMIDWVGGYPFEVAKPEEIFDFFQQRKFTMIQLATCAGGVGCNEYVFVKNC